MFNIIDTTLGVKADLVPLTQEPAYRRAFVRRARRTFADEDGTEFEAWCARPEDIITGKLMAWQEGRSDKHPGDMREMLVFVLSGLSDESLDIGYINLWAARLEDRCGPTIEQTPTTGRGGCPTAAGIG
ncbi:MAG: hypothetical protein SXV54_26790 [Chloroflexota bacterium]|nr:hypothetical protein [Chloroflexota bacterium]